MRTTSIQKFEQRTQQDFFENRGMSPEVLRGRETTFEERLEDMDLPPRIVESLTALCDKEADRRAFHQTMHALHWIAEKLRGHNTASAGVAVALGLSDFQSLSEIARRFNVSKQSVSKNAKALRGAFADLSQLPRRNAFKLPSK